MKKYYTFEHLVEILQDYEIMSTGKVPPKITRIEARQSRNPDTDEATVEIIAYFEDPPATAQQELPYARDHDPQSKRAK